MINVFSAKFDYVATLIRNTSLPLYFFDIRSMLEVEERRLNQVCVVQPTHVEHSSSPTLLLSDASYGGYGEQQGSSSRRGNGHGGGGNRQQQRRQSDQR